MGGWTIPNTFSCCRLEGCCENAIKNAPRVLRSVYLSVRSRLPVCLALMIGRRRRRRLMREWCAMFVCLFVCMVFFIMEKEMGHCCDNRLACLCVFPFSSDLHRSFLLIYVAVYKNGPLICSYSILRLTDWLIDWNNRVRVFQISADFPIRLWKGHYACAKILNVRLQMSTRSAQSCSTIMKILLEDHFQIEQKKKIS